MKADVVDEQHYNLSLSNDGGGLGGCLTSIGVCQYIPVCINGAHVATTQTIPQGFFFSFQVIMLP